MWYVRRGEGKQEVGRPVGKNLENSAQPQARLMQAPHRPGYEFPLLKNEDLVGVVHTACPEGHAVTWWPSLAIQLQRLVVNVGLYFVFLLQQRSV